MTATVFSTNLTDEQQRIDTRCEEIDETTAALANERKALVDRRKMLETVESMYSDSQNTIEEALETQLRLHPSASYEEGYEEAEEEDYEEDEDDNNEPNLKRVS